MTAPRPPGGGPALSEQGAQNLRAIQGLQEVLESRARVVRKARAALRDAARSAVLAELKVRRALSPFPEVQSRPLPTRGRLVAPLGGRECLASPTGFCAYDGAEDAARDECVFCGRPGGGSAPPIAPGCDCSECAGTHVVVNGMGNERPCDYCGCTL